MNNDELDELLIHLMNCWLVGDSRRFDEKFIIHQFRDESLVNHIIGVSKSVC